MGQSSSPVMAESFFIGTTGFEEAQRGMIRFITWATALAGMLLVFGFFGAWLAPADAVAQFRHILTALVVAGAIVTAFAGHRRFAINAALVGVAGLVLLDPHLPFQGPPAEGDAKIKLIQFNVKIHNAQEAEAAKWIINEQPDVVTLQEFLSTEHPGLEGLSNVLPNRVSCASSRLGDVAIFTRFPVITQGCTPGDGLAWMQVNVGGKPMTFASLHLPWPWPSRQWDQLAKLEPVFAGLPQPVVLAGDFNTVPWSAAMASVERRLKAKTIAGYRTTLWPDVFHNGQAWPMFPIDHVLLPDGIQATAVRIGPVIGSDHRPVIAKFDP